MGRKTFSLCDGHRRGARARKDQRNAKDRAAKAAAAMRKEVGDVQETVLSFEHKGGEAGESKLKPSLVSGDVAQSAPQNPVPGATGNRQQGPQPGYVNRGET